MIKFFKKVAPKSNELFNDVKKLLEFNGVPGEKAQEKCALVMFKAVIELTIAIKKKEDVNEASAKAQERIRTALTKATVFDRETQDTIILEYFDLLEVHSGGKDGQN